MENLYASMNTQIANWSVLYTKLHHYHWFVKGPLFFTLHEKFEELYNESANTVDELAEALLAIGGTPAATMKEYLSLAVIEEANKEQTANEMVAALLADYKQLKVGVKDLAELADKNGQDAINDLAVGLTGQLDKHIWMLSAYLG